MPRTCESIARVKIEHKQRTKRCNLQHFALSDGKNLRKYHSFSPRKWIKHSYLQGFADVTIRFFEKHVNTSVFCIHQGKKSVQKVQTISNLQWFGIVTGKKLRKYQRFSVQQWPKHRYLQCFVPSTFSWHSKNCVNTNIFCDQLAKHAVKTSVCKRACVLKLLCANASVCKSSLCKNFCV